MRLRFAAFALLASLVLAACGGSSTAGGSAGASPETVGPPATGKGTMVIVRGDNLFSLNVATPNDETQLTNETNSNFANNPAFSPDGTQIAYTYHIAPTGDQWGGAELHVMHADGSGDRVLVPAKAKGERAENAAWTPDGKSIYYAHDIPIIDASNHYTGDTLTIDSVDVATGQTHTIVKDAILPAISKTGELAWVIYDPSTSNFKLFVGNLDGSGGKALLSQNDFQAIWTTTFSPDGKTLAFSGSGRTNSKVASLGDQLADALNPLVPGRAEAHGLPWDPWTIGVDGTGLKKLVSLASDEQAMAWSPDGQDLVLANLSSTFLMRADGSGFTRLLTHGDPGGITWKA